MKRRNIAISITIGLILLGGVGFYVMRHNSTDQSSPDASSAQSKTVEATTTAPTPSQSTVVEKDGVLVELPKGSYSEYPGESVSYDTPGVTLLFFHAPWCPECRALDTDISKSTIPDGVTIYKVDYDSHQTLRQQYNVKVQTTVVRVDEKGDFVDSFVAYGSDKHTLSAVLDNLGVE